MFFVVTKYLTPRGFRGLTVYPFVFMRYASDKINLVFVNHEKIHLKQQLELFILPFFIWYLLEYLLRLVQYKNAFLAYKNISFEREAYANESDLDYLNRRKLYSFLSYFRPKSS
ncbi:hypothetical protein FFWV33_00470 [Flavobacterium faecale]|uniref:DUF4157 domain-containing protein n=1 Tax=Flavobacterium faecale TaxID=1355330 RepID=A0A2S1L8P4_9FLAO|nr:hypothetical protein [Flavobacterium faecale]AWG20097.1 hypothetical protein FFWV33_00470 [Flavobacterium faecale]